VSPGVVLGDWGNSRLRLWRMEGGALAERREAPGMSIVADARAALASGLDGWEATRVILCGMAGARNGLREAPYLRCPAGLADWSRQAAELAFESRTLTIAAGMADSGRPDVMRGEETQVFGAMALDPALSAGEHLFLLPGTHSKWVEVRDGRITRFQTHMTGELFELLSRSTLFSLAASDAANDGDGFVAGLERATEEGELTATLFEARAGQLVAGESPAWARGFVSGLLIGTEVRARMHSRPRAVVMIGEAGLTARYGEALAFHGVNASVLDGEACAVAGLRLLDADD
jgi:2-dehydro-3-deoxygalactonokinase